MSAPSPTEPPEAPRLGTLTVTEATPDSLRLSWGVARGPFESFVVQYQDTEGQRQALLVDGDQDKVLISGLEPSTSYKFFLYGLREGMRHGPISAEGTTGGPGLDYSSYLGAGKGASRSGCHGEGRRRHPGKAEVIWSLALHRFSSPPLSGIPRVALLLTSPTFLTNRARVQ